MIAPAKSEESDRCLPPSERAFEVYRLIEVDGLSTRAAADVVGLSQTRVIQLRDAVEEFVARQPSGTAGLTKQQRMQPRSTRPVCDSIICTAWPSKRSGSPRGRRSSAKTPAAASAW